MPTTSTPSSSSFVQPQSELQQKLARLARPLVALWKLACGDFTLVVRWPTLRILLGSTIVAQLLVAIVLYREFNEIHNGDTNVASFRSPFCLNLQGCWH
jgi:hypothetical protein